MQQPENGQSNARNMMRIKPTHLSTMPEVLISKQIPKTRPPTRSIINEDAIESGPGTLMNAHGARGTRRYKN
jgi:hypothetical protein